MYPEVLRPRLRPVFSVLPIIVFAIIVAGISSINAIRWLQAQTGLAPLIERKVIETWSTLTIVDTWSEPLLHTHTSYCEHPRYYVSQ